MTNPLMKTYQCILFDLDHTLWDFDLNSKETLRELFDHFRLTDRGISGFDYFYEVFVRVNTKLWQLHDQNLIGTDEIRMQRFYKVLNEAGLDDYPFSLTFSAAFLDELPKKKNLLPNTIEVLNYLQGRYPMAIVTNGFDELQANKMHASGIHHYFQRIVTSQRAGAKKPERRIFDFTLEEMGFTPAQSLMIGDNLQTDIAGARMAGLDTVFFNPHNNQHQESVTYEINDLKHLTSIL
jgi:putative hydrolase of the HAD superfamily